MGHHIAVALDNRLRRVREDRGLSQAELARRAGISRQALHAVETGRYVPNTAVALRLARALECAVEDLFVPRGETAVDAEWAGEGAPVRRVRIGRVRDRLVAWPLAGLDAATPADGVLLHDVYDGRVRIEPLADVGRMERTLLVAGCDPALRVAAGLAERTAGLSVHWIPASSARALAALARGRVHVAGTHLRPPDDPTGVRAIRRALGRTRARVVSLARWVEGLVLAPGNPRRIRSPEDLLRRGVRIVNRDAGAGSRAVLDRWLQRAGVDPRRIAGYDRELPTHFAVAEAVAGGLADAGPGVLPVARAWGLEFLPIVEQRYDLVVPEDLLALRSVRDFLDVLTSRAFRRELEAIGGYDPADAGTVTTLA